LSVFPVLFFCFITDWHAERSASRTTRRHLCFCFCFCFLASRSPLLLCSFFVWFRQTDSTNERTKEPSALASPFLSFESKRHAGGTNAPLLLCSFFCFGKPICQTKEPSASRLPPSSLLLLFFVWETDRHADRRNDWPLSVFPVLFFCFITDWHAERSASRTTRRPLCFCAPFFVSASRFEERTKVPSALPLLCFSLNHRQVVCRAKERNHWRPCPFFSLFCRSAVYPSTCQRKTKGWHQRLFLSVLFFAFPAFVSTKETIDRTTGVGSFFLVSSAVATTPHAGGGAANDCQNSASLLFIFGFWQVGW